MVIESKLKPAKNILFNSSNTFTRLLEKIKGGEKVLKLSGLEGSSKFYIVSELAKRLERPVLYLVPSREVGESAAEDIAFYSGEKPPLLQRKQLVSKGVLFSSLSNEMPERISSLYLAREKRILLAEAPALLEKRIPKDVLQDSIIQIRKGHEILRDNFISNLIQMGYVRADFVEKVGELSLRGAIVDLFSPGYENPLRLEFIGDEIGSIRHFRVNDQRSMEKIENVHILPASEIILNSSTINQSLSYIRKKAEEGEIPASQKLSLLGEIEKVERFPEIEWLLPSFYPSLSTVFDYIPADTLIVFDDSEEISKSVEDFSNSLTQTKSLIKKYIKVTPDISEFYISENQLRHEMSRFQRILIEDIEVLEDGVERIRFDTDKISIEKGGFDSAFEALSEKIREWQDSGLSVQLVLQTQVEGKRIWKILSERGVESVQIHSGTLSSGFIFSEEKIAVITEKEIYGERKKGRPTKTRDIPSAFITSFSELKPGDYIVHLDFGIGIFKGLRRLKLERVEGDFLECEYEGGDKVYVPVDKFKLVQRYLGGEKPPRIDKLGHQNWKRVVRRVKRAVESIAKELLELYARRKIEKGFQFSKRDTLFREFELTFPYEETPDQEAAIEDVMSDMESPRVMDRLICGDVGFGKTEVAIRGAFKAVMDGKQVAVLVPTTLLAYQHFITFTERLKGYPVLVDMFSRFRTQKEEKEILKQLEDGRIDIIIGTHKLLGNRVKFKNLGLTIVDEEQRFGAAHKEKLRDLKKADIMTLSATPIPRTLQLSLTGIRDISLINTPPEGRQPVETYVSQFDRAPIREAITRELKRGGAVFFIHNRIESIFRVSEEIRRLVPEGRIDITHGRMEERKLEKSISKFIQGETDVLITTAIVESGLDIPRANTIIVDNAHMFGLADLYQLRGRVGRSEKRAFAYFLIPSISSLTLDAKRRLKAIAELNELGSGFKLALSDLEIRGAGNLFGTEQSGHIADVGLELYLDMLDKAIKELKKEETQIDYDPEIRLNLPAFLPDDYICEGTERLLFYKKISSISSEKELGEIKNELKDRFGDIPEPALNLFNAVELKLLMKELLAQKAEIKEQETVIIFLQKSPLYHRFTPNGRFGIRHKPGEAISEIKRRLSQLNRSKVIEKGIG